MEIVNWCEEHKLDVNWIEQGIIFQLDEKLYLVLEEKDVIINDAYNLEANDLEYELLESVDRVAFKFGNKWYWSELEGDTKLNPLRYIGKVKSEIELGVDFTDIPFLGIHGKFELLNGSRDYKDWCNKAKFLGYKTLAICEQQTLAGTMLFQEACEESNIKPILGQTTYVKSKDYFYTVKLFVKNRTGWKNILKINKAQLVDNAEKKFVDENFLIENNKGLICVLTPTTELKEWRVKKYKKAFSEDIYFQFDLTEWKSERREREWLDSLQFYLTNFLEVLKPVFLNDAYYLDKIDSPTKKHLNDIGKLKYQHLSDDQYMKHPDDYFSPFVDLFENYIYAQDIFMLCLQNAEEIGEKCDFKINTKNRYLPKYKMTPEEKEKYSDSEELFWDKVQQGFERKIANKVPEQKHEEYLLRIEEEFEVLKEGDVLDYFLILSDICQWCRKNDVLVGHGRGSAAGSLISYILDITQVDPIEWDLLFSRFLTKGRLKGSLPDIDVDFSNRDAVIKYMKEKYGENYVASVATYGNLKVKNAIKDFGRNFGINPKEANYITGTIRKEYEASDFTKFLKCVLETPKLRAFFKKNPKVFEYFDLLLHQTRTASIHACATIIVPTEDENGDPVEIFDLMPVKSMDGELVTEWEGGQLEKSGFLKEDILGLSQLEKFDDIIKLIQKNTGEKVDIYETPINEKEVFELFAEGLNEDVFQFGTNGLKGYCKGLKPDSVEELTAATSLYRPGAMESNAHTDFIKIKFGDKEPEYDFLLKEVTEKTGGIYIYQEQIMKAYSVITDSTLEEADKFRKYITKAYKLKSKGIVDTEYEKYEKYFIKKYVEKGQNEKDAKQVWEKLMAFASYGFNRSHAVCYSFISYISQWFKVAYPLEFWSVSLKRADDDVRPKRLSELSKSTIKVYQVDINKSKKEFQESSEDNAIYWALSSVKWLGEVAVDIILEERNKNGLFFSLKEFLSRVPKSKVNKRGVTNMILCGAFDEMYKVIYEKERLYILDEYYDLIDEKDNIDKFLPQKENNTYWQLIQNELSGYGDISYDKVCLKEGFKKFKTSIEDCQIGSFATVAGLVTEIRVKNSNKVGDFAIITINSNNELIDILMWNDQYEIFKESLVGCEDKILILNGVVKFDTYNSKNNIQTNRETKLLIL